MTHAQAGALPVDWWGLNPDPFALGRGLPEGYLFILYT